MSAMTLALKKEVARALYAGSEDVEGCKVLWRSPWQNNRKYVYFTYEGRIYSLAVDREESSSGTYRSSYRDWTTPVIAVQKSEAMYVQRRLRHDEEAMEELLKETKYHLNPALRERYGLPEYWES